MKVRVTAGKCSGHARCAAVAPEVYVLNDDGYLDFPETAVAPDQEASARRGARACPERAIEIVEDCASMPRIRFIEHNGTEHMVDATTDLSLMRTALDHGVPGIVADCGGAMSCATCHVYVDQEWLPVVGSASEMETAMLESAIDPEANSRLSCQIQGSEAIDGLVLHIPKNQF